MTWTVGEIARLCYGTLGEIPVRILSVTSDEVIVGPHLGSSVGQEAHQWMNSVGAEVGGVRYSFVPETGEEIMHKNFRVLNIPMTLKKMP